MRTKLLFATILTMAFVGIAAGAAFAQGGGGPDQTAREQRISALREARNASIESFKENRTAALADYHAAFNATKASFLENKTRVLAECAALRNETSGNATPGGEGNNTGGCVKDGLKPLIEKAHHEHKAQKDTLKERLMSAREAAKASFAAARAKYGPRSG